MELTVPASRSRIADLNAEFRRGTLPGKLDGRFDGSLAGIDIAPGLSWLFRGLLGLYLPWYGKSFGAGAGDNIFDRSSRPIGAIVFPGYDGYRDDGPGTYRAFRFRTWVGAGLFDRDRSVLKIDYGRPENPRLTVRRILDELVRVGDDDYLGKAHVHWWWGRWQTVAYFRLRGPVGDSRDARP